MANNYCESASFLVIPEVKISKAQAIIDRVDNEIANLPEDENAYDVCTANTEIRVGNGPLNDNGVYFWSEETFDASHVTKIAQALVDELEIDEPFCFSWSYTCDKQRVDEFGGGACLVRRGEKPVYIDAMQHVLDIAKE